MNCSPEDFDKTENIITTAIMHEKRRMYSSKPTFLQMVTFGRNAVISADEEMHPWLREWAKGKTGFWLFEQHNFFELECELRRHGYKMAQTHHMFMPRTRGRGRAAADPYVTFCETMNSASQPLYSSDPNQFFQRTRGGDSVSDLSSDVGNSASQPLFPSDTEQFFTQTNCESPKPQFTIKWLEQADITPFYGREEFPNALCDRFHPERPDVLAVIALDGENIMGMAGCSADTPEMWQIGIDVLPQYRGKGVARTLVTLLKEEAQRRGALPFYGTSLSNIGSWRTAIDSGFIPAWVEVESRRLTDNEFAK